MKVPSHRACQIWQFFEKRWKLVKWLPLLYCYGWVALIGIFFLPVGIVLQSWYKYIFNVLAEKGIQVCVSRSVFCFGFVCVCNICWLEDEWMCESNIQQLVVSLAEYSEQNVHTLLINGKSFFPLALKRHMLTFHICPRRIINKFLKHSSNRKTT